MDEQQKRLDDEQKAAELDIEISKLQKELISNARNKIATELLILRLIDDVETCTLYRVRAGKLTTTLKELD